LLLVENIFVQFPDTTFASATYDSHFSHDEYFRNNVPSEQGLKLVRSAVTATKGKNSGQSFFVQKDRKRIQLCSSGDHINDLE